MNHLSYAAGQEGGGSSSRKVCIRSLDMVGVQLKQMSTSELLAVVNSARNSSFRYGTSQCPYVIPQT